MDFNSNVPKIYTLPGSVCIHLNRFWWIITKLEIEMSDTYGHVTGDLPLITFWLKPGDQEFKRGPKTVLFGTFMTLFLLNLGLVG